MMIGKKRKDSSQEDGNVVAGSSQKQQESVQQVAGSGGGDGQGPQNVRPPPPPQYPQQGGGGGWAPQFQQPGVAGGYGGGGVGYPQAMPFRPEQQQQQRGAGWAPQFQQSGVVVGYGGGGVGYPQAMPFRPEAVVAPPYQAIPRVPFYPPQRPTPPPYGGGYSPGAPFRPSAQPYYPQGQQVQHNTGAMPVGGHSPGAPFRPSPELRQAPMNPHAIPPYQAAPIPHQMWNRGGPRSSGTPFRPPAQVHRAAVAPYQATPTPHAASSHDGAVRPPGTSSSPMVNQAVRLQLHSEGTSAQAIQSIATSTMVNQTEQLALQSEGTSTQSVQPSVAPAMEERVEQFPLQTEGTSTLGVQPSEAATMVNQEEQLPLQTEGTCSRAIQPIAASSQSLKFPLRPGKGTLGIKCIVKANHFFAELPDKDLYQYDVSIIPEVTSRGVNRHVMKNLVDKYKDSHLGKRLPAYDGRKGLYTAGPLPFTSKEFSVTLVDEGETRSSRKKKQFRVVIKLAARADLKHLRLFLQGKQTELPHQALQILDIILQQLPTSRYCQFGPSFYSPNLGKLQSLGEGLESWRGFYQTFRPTQMGLSLNIDMSSTAFMEPLPVIEFITQLLHRDAVYRPLSDADRVKIKKALMNVKIKVTHQGNKGRKYRILGLSSKTPRELIFPVDERGTKKSVVQYFQEIYDYQIKHTTWPCLQVGTPERPSYLPMEVCQIVEGQRYSERLNERQITALLKVSCQRPCDREKDILETVRHNAYHNDPYALEFGIKISEELASVEARILPPPRLKYHDTGRERDCVPHIGQWSMMNKKLINGGTVNNWMCINFSDRVKESDAGRFCGNLAQICHSSGMTFKLKPVLPTYNARPDQAEKALKTLYNDRLSKLQSPHKGLDLLIVILPDNNGSLYGDVKRICETDLGLLSQCCLTKNVFKNSKQYMESLALKINVKVGGRNTALVDALSRRIPLVSDRPTIIFGADVTHPNPGENSRPSIAAVVASQDWPEVTKYAGLVSAQSCREELIHDLYTVGTSSGKSGGMIKELLISFRRATGQKPERIIFYRDGVSEAQFYQVLLYELDAIRKACASLEPNYQPPVTFVVVQKRHRTRLFAENHGDRRTVDRSGNIFPGTVVDSTICRPAEFDFYLCSHAGIQGTSSPSHYHVIWDENNFTADGLQSLTHNLCYTYVRCTRSVSIVPPVYYAHLAAFRARFYMEPEGSDNESLSSRGDGGGARSKRSQNINVPVRPLPSLKENVKKVMFYC